MPPPWYMITPDNIEAIRYYKAAAALLRCVFVMGRVSVKRTYTPGSRLTDTYSTLADGRSVV